MPLYIKKDKNNLNYVQQKRFYILIPKSVTIQNFVI